MIFVLWRQVFLLNRHTFEVFALLGLMTYSLSDCDMIDLNFLSVAKIRSLLSLVAGENNNLQFQSARRTVVDYTWDC